MSDITPNEIASATKQILTDMRADIHDLRSESRSDYRWLMGMLIGGFTALLGVIAHGFHWL